MLLRNIFDLCYKDKELIGIRARITIT